MWSWLPEVSILRRDPVVKKVAVVTNAYRSYWSCGRNMKLQESPVFSFFLTFFFVWRGSLRECTHVAYRSCGDFHIELPFPFKVEPPGGGNCRDQLYSCRFPFTSKFTPTGGMIPSRLCQHSRNPFFFCRLLTLHQDPSFFLYVDSIIYTRSRGVLSIVDVPYWNKQLHASTSSATPSPLLIVERIVRI